MFWGVKRNHSYGSELDTFSECGEDYGVEKYNPDDENHRAQAYIIDLDGTVYQPGGLISGAKEFFQYLDKENIPYVLLSNTGTKSFAGTQSKLYNHPYKVSECIIDKSRIRTAAEAQADYMIENIPPFSKIFVVSGGGSFWEELLKERNLSLFQTWDIKNHLTVKQAEDWAVLASRYKEVDEVHSAKVIVAFFLDGDVNDLEYSGWSYNLIKVCSFLVNKKAFFIYTADDPYNTTVNSKSPTNLLPDPGPGMFAAAIKAAMPPESEADGRILCCGKGGNIGHEYMMERAIEMLRSQGYEGPKDKIMMVGDRYITDIRAGNHANIMSCLVESGCNKISELPYYSTDRPSFWSPAIGCLIPDHANSHDSVNRKPLHKSPSLLEQIELLSPADLLKVWLIKSDRDHCDSFLRFYYQKIIKAKQLQPEKNFNLKDLDSACEILEIKSKDASFIVKDKGITNHDLSEDQFVEIIQELTIEK